MSFIRLLALSYLAWAAVFVAAMVLVAHLPLPGNAIGGTGAPVARTAAIAPPAGEPEVHKVARLDLAPAPVPVARSLADVPQPIRIPDPPPSSFANLPVQLQPAASQNKKRARVEPAFHIPDPPPLEPGRL